MSISWRAPVMCTIAALMPHVGFCRLPSEQSRACPPQTCPPPSVEECSDVIACQDLYALQNRCAPRCQPVFCDAARGASALDVDANCRLTEADLLLVGKALSQGLGGAVNAANFWYDADGSKVVDTADQEVLTQALTDHGCLPTPSPTAPQRSHQHQQELQLPHQLPRRRQSQR